MAGQKTALVGESGSGKSTLAKLLIHYYDPQKGSISIGGQKLCDMSLEALNSHISYVAQDQYLFNTSLLENIRLGRLNATDEEVMEAAKKAQCMEFLENCPRVFILWPVTQERCSLAVSASVSPWRGRS